MVGADVRGEDGVVAAPVGAHAFAFAHVPQDRRARRAFLTSGGKQKFAVETEGEGVDIAIGKGQGADQGKFV